MMIDVGERPDVQLGIRVRQNGARFRLPGHDCVAEIREVALVKSGFQAAWRVHVSALNRLEVVADGFGEGVGHDVRVHGPEKCEHEVHVLLHAVISHDFQRLAVRL